VLYNEIHKYAILRWFLFFEVMSYTNTSFTKWFGIEISNDNIEIIKIKNTYVKYLC